MTYRAKIEKYQRMKDIDIDVQEIADVTGYEKEFLDEAVQELVGDGETWEEAVAEVRDISIERDW